MQSKITAGAIAGVVAGVFFGLMMQMMTAPTPEGADAGMRPVAMVASSAT